MRALLLAAFLCAVTSEAFALRGDISCYGNENGPHTASGEHFNPHAMTAAIWGIPFGTWLHVTYNGRSVDVRVNDRGPSKRLHRIADLTIAACARIGLLGPGHGIATIEVIRK